MPQMKPMNWMFLLIFITFSFFCYTTFLFYYNKMNKNICKSFNNKKIQKKAFSW